MEELEFLDAISTLQVEILDTLWQWKDIINI